ncbi:MAG: hypothetical protein IPL03_13560 [Sterolibacteriaceae bacterium]|nr:hypothetical protein [Candidatus Methylophosphatis haderslevensis]
MAACASIDTGIQHPGAWPGGNGCAPILNLMPYAASAKIGRSQVRRWVAPLVRSLARRAMKNRLHVLKANRCRGVLK